MSHHVPLRISLLILGLLGTLALRAQPPSETDNTEVFKIDMMTQNLYVGADVFRILEGSECGPLESVFNIFQTVQGTNFPERAEAIADLVLHNKPQVIGLQEVSLIRSQTPADFEIVINPDGTLTYLPNAGDVVYDYLQILLDALAARGLDYVAVEGAISENADVEFPMASFDEVCNFTSIPMDLRLTDRDVILVRRGLVTANATNMNFAVNLVVEVPLVPGIDLTFEFTRGFGAVDVQIGRRTQRVVNVHLEAGDAADPGSPLNIIQLLQTMEMIGATSDTPLPLGVLGDFNSSPSPLDARPAYATMIGSGYLDLWTVRQGPPDPGDTCCQEELLRNEVSQLDERIDLVFSRLPADSTLLPIRSRVVGDAANDKTASGMWPSDHAGVVTTLKFKR